MDFDKIVEMLWTAMAGVGLLFLAQLLKTGKAGLLREISRLVQEAEQVIQGTGMGGEKKRWVMAQLEAAGETITRKVSQQIDQVVSALNASGAWLGQQVRQHTDEDKP